jgi:hypothetical protein
MKRLMNSPRASSPEQPLGHVVCKPSIYKNRFHFQTREVARKTLNIASLREMKVTVPSLSDQRSAIRKVVRAFAWIDRIALENH